MATLLRLFIAWALLNCIAQATPPDSGGQSAFSIRGRLWSNHGIVSSTLHIAEGTFHESAQGPTFPTDGLILPGLIELHDHISYNYLPRFAGNLWEPDRVFQNRYEWRREPQVLELMDAHAELTSLHPLAPDVFGMLRELVGGTTAVVDGVPKELRGRYVRSLVDQPSATARPIEDAVFFLELAPLEETPPRVQISSRTVRKIRQSSQAFVHLAEGRRDDPLTRREIDAFFNWAVGDPEAARKVIPIHAVGFEDSDFRRLKALGVRGVVWSPSSNLALYGQTMKVESALRHGLEVALGTDWYPSGTDSLFDELRFAKDWVQSQGLELDSATLNAMILEAPAKILRHPSLGTLEPGAAADFIVVPWLGNLDASLQAADIDNMQLVVVGGKPLFGVHAWMRLLAPVTFASPTRPTNYSYGVDPSPAIELLRSETPIESLGELRPPFHYGWFTP